MPATRTSRTERVSNSARRAPNRRSVTVTYVDSPNPGRSIAITRRPAQAQRRELPSNRNSPRELQHRSHCLAVLGKAQQAPILQANFMLGEALSGDLTIEPLPESSTDSCRPAEVPWVVVFGHTAAQPEGSSPAEAHAAYTVRSGAPARRGPCRRRLPPCPSTGGTLRRLATSFAVTVMLQCASGRAQTQPPCPTDNGGMARALSPRWRRIDRSACAR